eukprot:m.42013 g.42013  ORF g.42013 m.42013 type:complete len:76 (+) comp14991_c0_seq10:808-1035(+)
MPLGTNANVLNHTGAISDVKNSERFLSCDITLILCCSAYRKKECVCFQKSDIEATTLHVDAARQQTSTGESVNPH